MAEGGRDFPKGVEESVDKKVESGGSVDLDELERKARNIASDLQVTRFQLQEQRKFMAVLNKDCDDAVRARNFKAFRSLRSQRVHFQNQTVELERQVRSLTIELDILKEKLPKVDFSFYDDEECEWG